MVLEGILVMFVSMVIGALAFGAGYYLEGYLHNKRKENKRAK